MFGEKMILSAIFSLSALCISYFYLTRNYNYWRKRGIRGPKPVLLLGTLWQIFKKPIVEVMMDNRKKYGNIYGGFMTTRPNIMIGDPELIKAMNITDFHHFTDHTDMKSGDPLNDRSLFNLMGNEWKPMRSVISPTFSSGKMRAMHPIIINCVHRLDKYLETKAINGSEFDLRQTMGNLTMDVIAASAFGTQIDTHNDHKTNEFVKNADSIIKGNWRVWLVFPLMSIFPTLAERLGLSIFSPSVRQFFKSAISTIIARRRAEPNACKHRDYLQLMINAQNKSADNSADNETDIHDLTEQVFGKTETFNDQNAANVVITDDDMLANSLLFLIAGNETTATLLSFLLYEFLLFLIAGNETTATLLSFLLYELSVNENCQQRLYEEIRGFAGDYSYESIARMPYLEACVAETLRHYPPNPAVTRICTEQYVLGDTGLTIPKGMTVNFDVYGIHHSPEYYPNPERWDPERFLPSNRDQLVPYTYMPFGLGPRNCVGMRFALMQAKTTVAHLIDKYRFKRTANTRYPPTFEMFEFVLTSDDINIGIELR
ncbi:unnamed protein product [Medioppia subpectinata]|uniref:Cytochrome P450 n=1 Tax=Medioppia subpectinata TaxID=1979941 RepID=A0A7R9KM87_9ACAR|nr:unnamed protein product [Medioppia subpectinata]CAG2104873.1 unnamed protein product [Medioppia subpectinata]